MNKITNRTTKKQIMAMELELSDSLRNCSKKLRDDKDVVMKFIEEGISNFEFASERLRGDAEIVKLAVGRELLGFLYASDDLRKNKEFILELVKLYGPKPIEQCYYDTRDEIYERLKNPAIQVLEEMIEEDKS